MKLIARHVHVNACKSEPLYWYRKAAMASLVPHTIHRGDYTHRLALKGIVPGLETVRYLLHW